MNEYLNACRVALNSISLAAPINHEIEHERVQQACVQIWLAQKTGISSWPKIFDYFAKAGKRTVENNRVTKTIVIDRNIDASALQLLELDDPSISKVIDWLGSSTYSFLRVTESLKIIGYETVSYSSIQDPSSYLFIPGFVYPVSSQMSPGDTEGRVPNVLVSTNQKGDIVISLRGSILASRRKGQWTIYDNRTLKNSIRDCIGCGERIIGTPYGLACTLFQVLFDMSFKRHGGLIIVDRSVEDFNQYTFGGVRRGESQATDVLFPLGSLDTTTPSAADIRKLLELSSVDGAVLFTLDGHMQGFGAMIRSGNTNTFGARTAAAKAAVEAGAVAFKVSSDGDISIYFKTRSTTSDTIHEIKFL
ncbi:hypothetical protein [Bdellovibrio bacteriovorus]|uniref:hypothetical protein n=1 Tax=Bdellovibrio bacteriovorus TaxID=959 RepID=UPI0035A6DE1B